MRISNEQVRIWYRIFMNKSLANAKVEIKEVDFASFFFTINTMNELRKDGYVNIEGRPINKYKLADKFKDLLISKKIKYDNSSYFHDMMEFTLLEGHSEIESHRYNDGMKTLEEIEALIVQHNEEAAITAELNETKPKVKAMPQGHAVRILDTDEFERVQKVIEMRTGCKFTYNNITEAQECETFSDVKNRVVIDGKLPVESTSGVVPVILKKEMIAFIDGSLYNFDVEEQLEYWFRHVIKVTGA